VDALRTSQPLFSSHQSSKLHLYTSPTNSFYQTSIVSFGNSIQSYTTLYYTRRIYNIDPSRPKQLPSTPSAPVPHSPLVTPLSARTFGTWTFVAAIVRLFAAYNIDHPAFYALAFCMYVVAFAHFGSEWLVYGTAEWGSPLAGPMIVSTSTIAWMVAQWGFYVAA
jgi:hypothetical protein